jgi:hypothetical protein
MRRLLATVIVTTAAIAVVWPVGAAEAAWARGSGVLPRPIRVELELQGCEVENLPPKDPRNCRRSTATDPSDRSRAGLWVSGVRPGGHAAGRRSA